MSFRPYNGAENGRTRRKQNEVVIYLSPRQPVPDMVPYELHEHVFPDDWHTRITTIRDVAFRFYKPVFERIWFMVATLSVIVLPLVLYQVLINAIPDNDNRFQRVYEARAAMFGVLVGTILLFFMPMFIWKTIGALRIRRLLKGWAAVDRAGKTPNAFVPVWTVQSPTVFKSNCIVSITIPPTAKPTIFHPDAYLPSYIARPADDGVPYYYPYAPGQAGLPRMSTAGALPGYQAQPGKEHYFEDIKLQQA